MLDRLVAGLVKRVGVVAAASSGALREVTHSDVELVDGLHRSTRPGSDRPLDRPVRLKFLLEV